MLKDVTPETLKKKVLYLSRHGMSPKAIGFELGIPHELVRQLRNAEYCVAAHNTNQPYIHERMAEPFNPDDAGGGLRWVRLLLPRELVAAAALIAEHHGQSFHTFLAAVLRGEVHWQPVMDVKDVTDMVSGAKEAG